MGGVARVQETVATGLRPTHRTPQVAGRLGTLSALLSRAEAWLLGQSDAHSLEQISRMRVPADIVSKASPSSAARAAGTSLWKEAFAWSGRTGIEEEKPLSNVPPLSRCARRSPPSRWRVSRVDDRQTHRSSAHDPLAHRYTMPPMQPLTAGLRADPDAGVVRAASLTGKLPLVAQIF